MTAPSGSICVTFVFLKGALVGQSITAQFNADVSVSQLKNFLIQTHHACDPSTRSLKFVCEQTLQVLSDDETVGSLHLPSIDICVNVTRKNPPLAVEAPVPPTADITSPFTTDQGSAISCSYLAPPPPITSNPCPAAAALSNDLHDGSRVRIEGLRSKPELNGCCGSICGAYNVLSGRWVVRVDPAAADAACGDDECCVAVKLENLRAISQLQHLHPSPSVFTPAPQPKAPDSHCSPTSESKNPNVVATGPAAAALISSMSAIFLKGDDSFVTGANLSHDQQTKMRDAARVLQQRSAAGEVDMSAFLSLYEDIRKPEDKAIDSILPILTMVCLHSLSNKALLGAIGVVVTSAEDSRVTVALIIAHDDMFTAYPVGVKIKATSCRTLSPEEVSVIPPAKMKEGLSRYNHYKRDHPDPQKAEVQRMMDEQMSDPAFAKAVRNARKSHPNYVAMVARLGLSEKDVADWERDMDEDMARRASARAAARADSETDVATLQWGQRVVTAGLSTEWLNGATCSVAGAYDASSGRYVLRVHSPPDAVRKCGGMALLKRDNLVCEKWSKPRVDPTTNWVDEFGWVCSKAVKYGQQCPRSHDVVCKGATGPQIGACSVCDEAEAPDVWPCCGGCGYSVCVECRDLLMQQQASNAMPAPAAIVNSHEFPMLGIRLSGIKMFKQRWRRVYENMTTSHVCNFIVRPLSARRRGSLCDAMLQHPRTSRCVARANWFVSHTWQNKFSDTIDAVLFFFESKAEAGDVVLWFDVFSVPQHEMQETPRPPSWWMNTFKSSIERMGNLILVVDKWNDPSALKRAWCVLELYAIISKMRSGGGRFEIAMTIAEHTLFLDKTQTEEFRDMHYKILCSSNVEKSDCSRDCDRQSIHSAIRESVGFDHLNRAIVEVMEKWMLQQLGNHVEVQDEEEIHRAKATMASMLFDQGRYDEAIVLEEQILAYSRRTHPAGHIDIGVALSNLAISYRDHGRCHDALPMFFEALSIYEQKLEPTHVYIGREFGNIGACYQAMRCPADCLRMHKRALQWRRQHLSPDDPEIGMALFSVATAYMISNECELAVQWFQDAIEFQKRVLPPNHPNLSDTLCNLSVAYRSCDRYDEAICAIEEAVALLKRIRAPDHPSLLKALMFQSEAHADAAHYFGSRP